MKVYHTSRDELTHTAGLGSVAASRFVPSTVKPEPVNATAFGHLLLAGAVAPSHGVGEHTVLRPWNTLGDTHAAAVVLVHVPVVEQHAPTHGFGEQVVPKPLNVLGLTQPAAVVSVQVPVVEQHAPAQRFGVQVVPGPWNTPAPHAAAFATNVQVVPLQHAPNVARSVMVTVTPPVGIVRLFQRATRMITGTPAGRIVVSNCDVLLVQGDGPVSLHEVLEEPVE